MNISVACEGAEKFVKLYYGKFDSNRHVSVTEKFCFCVWIVMYV